MFAELHHAAIDNISRYSDDIGLQPVHFGDDSVDVRLFDRGADMYIADLNDG